MNHPQRRFLAFLDGALWPLRGARIILVNPRLWGWVIVPAVINATLLFLGITAVLSLTPTVLSWLWPVPPGAGLLIRTLWWVVAVLLMGTLLTLTAVGTYFLSGLVALPFLDQLSDRVEVMQIGPREQATSWAEFFGDIGVSMLHTVLGLLTWAVAMISLLVVGLIPVVGPPVEAVLSLCVTALLLSREMMDGPLSRRRVGYLAKLRTVWRHTPTTLGFGLVVAALLWVPLLNFLLLPVAVVGGTLMYLSFEAQERADADP